MRIAMTLAGAAALLATPALADRGPTAAERTAIEAKLRAAGYGTWEEIELDDHGPMWEVDDARKANDKRRYDLKLAPKTYAVMRTKVDD